MTKKRRIFDTFLLSIFFTLIILGFSSHRAEATTSSVPTFHFEMNSKKLTAGSEAEIKTASTYVYAVEDTGAVPTSVVWTTSEPGVVKLEATATASCEKIVRTGPGYSTITATITQGGFSYMISFVVFVNLEVDHASTGTKLATITNTRILIMDLDTVEKEKTVYVKYLDYTADDTPTVTGSAISTDSLSFTSSDTGVVTVDSKGKVTAVGSGTATITITSTTMSATDKALSTSLRVTVRPKFSFTYSYIDDKGKNVDVTCNSYIDNKGTYGVYTGVPPSFVLNTNATKASNLVWVIYNVVDGKRTEVLSTSKLMTYKINDSGTVSFSNIKAGTYEIYAFVHKDYDEKAIVVPYAYMKISVPIALKNQLIIMNVGDTYNLLDNSNITSKSMYIEPTDYETDIAKFDIETYNITAKKQGSVIINLVYDTDQDLFEGSISGDITITVKVIDGITLSTNKATIYTKGKIQLQALASDSTSPIVWSSSNEKIATVAGGLVTGVSNGTTFIKATQTINGVVKTATCTITVQQSVETITVTPATASLGIKGFLTLHAEITPKDLSQITLQWKSSNESVVKVVETSALTATVQALAGGHAVVSAINQDNVVVGYCDITVQQPVTGVTLSETAVTVTTAQKTLQLRATIYPDNATNKDVTWGTTDKTKATVDANGIVTILKPGTVTISATSNDNAKAVAYCTVTILIPAVSITLDETAKTMYVGQSARLTYSLLPANASNNAVTWTSTNTTVATVDAAGKVTAKGVGTSVIMLKTADGGFSAYCTITVKLVATTVKFDVSKLNLKTSEYYVIKTTLTPSGSTDNGLSWESSDTKVATVDTEGKIVGKNAGTCIITARTEAGGVAYCTVTVTQAVTGLVLNFSDKTIFKGAKLTLEASITPTSATKPDVTWKSSNTNIATITDKGEVTGVTGGVTIITCTTTDGGYAATCVLTVKEAVTKLTLNYETYKLGIKKTVKLVATVSNETATNQKVKWTSSNKKIATVSSTGKVTGLKSGYAVITALAQDGSEVETSCEVRVVTLATSISISKTTMALFVGESKTLKAKVKPSNATYKKAKWSSSDSGVAIVNEDGGVIGIKAGSTVITAEALDSSGKSAICYVTVYDRVASTGITLQDKKITMVPGENKIVEMVLIPSASTDKVTWSSDNAAVAAVDKNTGKIHAKSTGTVYITVMTDSGKTATLEVTVIGLNITKLITEQYTDYPQALNVEGATGTVVWKSSNPLIATISSDGTVGARGVGTTKITATVNGRRLTCTVIVNAMK